MMKLNTRALLKAVGVGLVIELVMFGLGAVTLATSVNPGASPEQILSSGVMGIGACLSCIEYLLYGVMGAIYGWFAHRDQEAVDVGQTALGGGITAVIVGMIGTTASMIYNAAIGTLASSMGRITSQAGGQSGAIVIGSFVMVFCMVFVLSGGLGAAGGAIYAAIVKRRQSQSTTPSV